MTLLESYSPREREKWLLTAFRAGTQEWKQASPTYRKFLKDLTQARRQEFLDYLHRETLLGDMRYPLDDPGLFYQMAYELEGMQKNYKYASTHLAFSLLLSFGIDLKLSTLHKYMKEKRLTTADWRDFLATTQVG
jgi:hypothetical protein